MPTASTHHVRERGHDHERVRDGAENPDGAADEGEQQAFGQEQPPHRRRSEPDRAQQTHLARALLDAELEEQRGQQQRGHDEEEAEVDEVLAEVRRAAGRRQALGPHVADGQSGCQRIDPRAQTLLDLLAGPLDGTTDGWRGPNRRQRTIPRSPETLADLQRHERLRRRSIGVPVRFVGRADAAQIDWKRRIPIAKGW